MPKVESGHRASLLTAVPGTVGETSMSSVRVATPAKVAPFPTRKSVMVPTENGAAEMIDDAASDMRKQRMTIIPLLV